MEQVAASLLQRARRALWNVASLKTLLAEMAARGVSIDPLLLDAAYQELPDAMIILLAHGASVQAVDDCGRTALHYAISRAQILCVRLLLRHGASVHVQDSNGHTPMATLIRCSASNKTLHTCDCANLLLSDGAQLPPHHVVWTLLWSRSPEEWCEHEDKHPRFIQLLLDNHVDPNTRNTEGDPPMLIHMNHRATACLLAHGADANLPNAMGFTALMMAVTMRCAKTVALLLRYKADVNVLCRGRTALSIAYESSRCVHWSQSERDAAAECTRLIATKLRNQAALRYGCTLLKAGVTRDVRCLMVRAFGEMFTVEGYTGQHDGKRVRRIK